MPSTLAYVHLAPGAPPPPLASQAPFYAILVIEEAVTPEWQAQVSAWLVQSGCLYMMAWGNGCSLWDDSVDMANLEAFDFGDIPANKDVMTTWHENEPLSEVFWFAKNSAFHPTVELEKTVILHISRNPDKDSLTLAYHEA